MLKRIHDGLKAEDAEKYTYDFSSGIEVQHNMVISAKLRTELLNERANFGYINDYARRVSDLVRKNFHNSARRVNLTPEERARENQEKRRNARKNQVSK